MSLLRFGFTAKKRAAASAATAHHHNLVPGSCKRTKRAGDVVSLHDERLEINGKDQRKRIPLRFASFNANSLVLRCKNDADALRAFVKTNQPDVFCVQEVRMAATSAEKRGAPARKTKAQKADWAIVSSVLQSSPFNDYKVYWSLADTKYSGVCAFVRRDVDIRRIRFSFPGEADGHDPEGRVMVLEFPNVTVFNTYAPNNGNREERFARRRAWDARLDAAVSAARGANLMWLGDLNACKSDGEMSHPQFFKDGVYRTNVGKRWGRPKHAGDAGQPACTPNEMRRFNEIIQRGGLVDPHAASPEFTWRGTPHCPVYGGKGMRIDYTLVSETIASQIASATIYGTGRSRTGFLGSDHCPIGIVLKSE